MNDLQKSVIIAFAENGMNVEKTARVMHYHRSNIIYHLENVEKKTGLNPRNFFDLIKLYELATGEAGFTRKMTMKQAIAYLQPIADNAQICGYLEALNMAMEAMREVEKRSEQKGNIDHVED